MCNLVGGIQFHSHSLIYTILNHPSLGIKIERFQRASANVAFHSTAPFTQPFVLVYIYPEIFSPLLQDFRSMCRSWGGRLSWGHKMNMKCTLNSIYNNNSRNLERISNFWTLMCSWRMSCWGNWKEMHPTHVAVGSWILTINSSNEMLRDFWAALHPGQSSCLSFPSHYFGACSSLSLAALHFKQSSPPPHHISDCPWWKYFCSCGFHGKCV